MVSLQPLGIPSKEAGQLPAKSLSMVYRAAELGDEVCNHTLDRLVFTLVIESVILQFARFAPPEDVITKRN